MHYAAPHGLNDVLQVAQEYEEHLGAVNTVTFIDENRRFISTSDDKKIFIWEYGMYAALSILYPVSVLIHRAGLPDAGIPVVIKHIAESDQHSVPYVELHPSNKWILGQSQDNQILVYATNKVLYAMLCRYMCADPIFTIAVAVAIDR